MNQERVRRIVAVLPPAEYRRLVALAERESRSPDLQVTHIVRRALARTRLPESTDAATAAGS